MNSIIDSTSAERWPPTILQILPALESGGVERAAVDVSVALRQAGWRAIVASEGGRMLRELERAGVDHVVLPLATKNPLAIRANADRLAALIEDRAVDLVHVRSRAPGWSALKAARATGKPLVTTFHGAYNFGNSLKRRYNSVMARGDRVIAISAFIADHLRQHYDVGDDRLRLIHRGIDYTRFDPARVGGERLVKWSRKWRLPDDAPVVMLPARLTRWKGQGLLIDALAILGRHDLRCLLVGDNQGRESYCEALERQIADRGLEGVVQFAGHCDDMPAAYMLADVVVAPSLDPEAFGRAAVEAQAMGRPTIVSDHGAAVETLVPGKTGWLTPPGDAAGLARCLEQALALDARDRAALAAQATARVRALFANETMCAATLAVYRELLTDDVDGRGSE